MRKRRVLFGKMVKQKHYKVEGHFIIDFSRFVSAKTEAEAIRKARDFVVKNMKIKKSQLDRQNVAVWNLD